jgi:hypothetical protein
VVKYLEKHIEVPPMQTKDLVAASCHPLFPAIKQDLDRFENGIQNLSRDISTDIYYALSSMKVVFLSDNIIYAEVEPRNSVEEFIVQYLKKVYGMPVIVSSSRGLFYASGTLRQVCFTHEHLMDLIDRMTQSTEIPQQSHLHMTAETPPIIPPSLT